MIKIADIEIGSFPLLLAPMEDVSDPPFRALCKENGADVVYTEFISSEGLIRDAAKSKIKLDIYEKERPVGIQIFGANLDSMLKAVDIVEKTKPDIIDINFGCPVKKVVSKGADESLEAYSGFQGTELSEILKEHGVKKVFICGLATDYCVRATAIDARKEGFEVILISDCVESVNIEESDGEKALKEMVEFGCVILDSDDLT